jgi:hypothetical protein
MKNLTILIIFLILLKTGFSQQLPGDAIGNAKTATDTLLIYRPGGGGTKVVLRTDSALNSLPGGILTNIKHGGLAEFTHSRPFQDSFLIIGGDTIKVKGTGGSAGPEIDPVIHRAILNTLRRSLDTAYTPNNVAIVRDTAQGGLFTLRDSIGYTNKIDSGIYFRSLQDPSKIWQRDRSQANGLHPEWWGAVADGVTDCKPAFRRMFNSMYLSELFRGSNQPNPGNQIILGKGTYFFSDSFRINRSTTWMGSGSFLGSATHCTFPPNSDGFVIMRYNSYSLDTAGNAIDYGPYSRAADGTIFMNIDVHQQEGGTRGIGLWSKAEFAAINCSFTNWPSAGAVVIANLGVSTELAKQLKNIYIANPGTLKYNSPPAVTLTPNNGSVVHAVLGGGIGNARLTDPGAGYVEPPVTRVQESGDYLETNILTRGFGADVDVHMGINTVAGDNQGSGYTFANFVVNAPSGSGASGHCIISAGKVIGYVVDVPGSDYLDVNTCSIVITGDGTGATGHVVDFKVASLNIHTRGKNYEQDQIPHIYFIGGRRNTGHDAAATVDSIINLFVKRIAIDTRGGDLNRDPDISFSGGGGTGAVAWSTRFGTEGGDANRWRLENCSFLNNGYGLIISGSDANAGYAIGCNATGNLLYGVWDNSFLGDTHIGWHASANGWGPYLSTQNTANNLFINCYSEGNQPPMAGLNPARIIAGTMGAGVRGTIETDNSPINRNRFSTEGSQDATMFAVENDELMRITNGSMDAGGTYRWHLSNTNTDMWWDAYNSMSKMWQYMTGEYTSQKFQRLDTVPYATYITQLFLGSTVALSHQIARTNVFPPQRYATQKGWSNGDFAINTFPTLNASDSSMTLFYLRKTTNDNSDVLGVDWIPGKVSFKQSTGFNNSGFDQTFANTDLTATGNRLHHFKNFSLTIDSLSGFTTNIVAKATTREYLWKGSVSDDPANIMFLGNNTSAASQFHGLIGSYVSGSDGGINIRPLYAAANDAGVVAAINLNPAITSSSADPLNGTFSSLVNRELVRMSNNGTELFLLHPNGKLRFDVYKNNVAEDSVFIPDINGNVKLKKFTASGGGLTSIGLSMPPAFSVSPGTLTANGTFNVTGAGTTAQYVRGDGSLATFPTIPAQFNPIQGTGITITGTYPNMTFSTTGGGAGNLTINTSNGITVDGGTTATKSMTTNQTFAISSTTLSGSLTTGSFSLAAGTFQDFTITVTGAVLNDPVSVGSSTFSAGDIDVRGEVTNADQVTVRVKNNGAFTIIFSGLTFNVKVK